MAHARSTHTEGEWAADGAVCGAEPRNATTDSKKSCFSNRLIEAHSVLSFFVCLFVCLFYS